MAKKIPVMEVFGPTIQGEGKMIGQQTYFVRFGLCDFACTMCDSMHAVDPKLVRKNGLWMYQEAIAEALTEQKSHFPNSTDWVTFSGGNPCIHDLGVLVKTLKRYGWKIAVETQGTLTHPWLREVDHIAISPKPPGMGETIDISVLNHFLGSLDLNIRNAIFKFVVFGITDLEVIASIANHFKIPPESLYLSQGNPYVQEDWDVEQLTYRLREKYLETFELIKTFPGLSQVKFLPQWHTWVWANAKGV